MFGVLGGLFSQDDITDGVKDGEPQISDAVHVVDEHDVDIMAAFANGLQCAAAYQGGYYERAAEIAAQYGATLAQLAADLEIVPPDRMR